MRQPNKTIKKVFKNTLVFYCNSQCVTHDQLKRDIYVKEHRYACKNWSTDPDFSRQGFSFSKHVRASRHVFLGSDHKRFLDSKCIKSVRRPGFAWARRGSPRLSTWIYGGRSGDNNNNNNHDNVYGALIMTKVIARVHPVHLMNVDWAPGGRQPLRFY